MKVTAEEARRSGKQYRVFFEGSERKMVIEADEEARCLLVFSLNDKGNAFVKPGGDEIATERIYGHVRIEEMT